MFPRVVSRTVPVVDSICGYVQRVLGTSVGTGGVEEQHAYSGGLRLYTAIILGVHYLEIGNRLAWHAWLTHAAETEAMCIWKLSTLGTFRW